MRISEVKKQAKELLNQKSNRVKFLRVIFMVSVIQLLPTFLGDIDESGISGNILNILILPVFQGIIISSLKIVNNQDVCKNDALLGIKNYKSYISTYILNVFISLLLVGLVGLVLLIFLGFSLDENTISIYKHSWYDKINMINLIKGNRIMIIILTMFIITYVIGAFTSLSYYLLEEYGLKNIEAIKTSCAIMKHQIINYTKLMISFVDWFLLSYIIEIFIGIFIDDQTLIKLVSNIFRIFTYLPMLYLCQALFYKDITKDYKINKKG